MATTPEAAAKLTVLAGTRHENPGPAIELLKKYDLAVPPLAFAVIRHPVDRPGSLGRLADLVRDPGARPDHGN